MVYKCRKTIEQVTINVKWNKRWNKEEDGR